jgi:hypothetical protein
MNRYEVSQILTVPKLEFVKYLYLDLEFVIFVFALISVRWNNHICIIWSSYKVTPNSLFHNDSHSCKFFLGYVSIIYEADLLACAPVSPLFVRIRKSKCSLFRGYSSSSVILILSVTRLVYQTLRDFANITVVDSVEYRLAVRQRPQNKQLFNSRC